MMDLMKKQIEKLIKYDKREAKAYLEGLQDGGDFYIALLREENELRKN